MIKILKTRFIYYYKYYYEYEKFFLVWFRSKVIFAQCKTVMHNKWISLKNEESIIKRV